jgi:hypothetical protein
LKKGKNQKPVLGPSTPFRINSASCLLCDRYKGSDVAAPDPTTGEIVPLFNPRQQRWQEHFTLQGALIVARTFLRSMLKPSIIENV